MRPVIDHIHITVEDLERAERFYDRLLPLLGFDLSHKEKESEPEDDDYKIIEYNHKNFSFGIVNQSEGHGNERRGGRKAGAVHHLAFHVPGMAEVDELFGKVKALGAEIVYEPKLYPEYCHDYYAFFFLDSEGIEYEIVSFDRKSYF